MAKAKTTKVANIINPAYDFQHPAGVPLVNGSYVPELPGASSVMTQVGAILVMNNAGQILVGMNRKRHVWDIPQGVVEAGETPADAALRELMEETNLNLAHTELEEIGTFRHKTIEFVYPWETVMYIANTDKDVSLARNMEQEKCDRLAWFAPIQLPFPRGLSLRMALTLLGH